MTYRCPVPEYIVRYMNDEEVAKLLSSSKSNRFVFSSGFGSRIYSGNLESITFGKNRKDRRWDVKFANLCEEG